MADYGIKVTKPGKDVRDAEDTEMILRSGYPMMKIVKMGSGTITIPVTNTSGESDTIAHGLSYAPLAIVFSQVLVGYSEPVSGSEGYGRLPITTETYFDVTDEAYFTTDTTNLTVGHAFPMDNPLYVLDHPDQVEVELGYYYVIYDNEFSG